MVIAKQYLKLSITTFIGDNVEKQLLFATSVKMTVSTKNLMRQFLVNRLNFEVVSLIIIIFVYPHVSWSEELDKKILFDKILTIDCQYEPINEVLNDISKQSGLVITYDRELDDVSILPLIAFNDNIKAFDAVVRLLRGINTVIEFSNDQRNINIRMFDN